MKYFLVGFFFLSLISCRQSSPTSSYEIIQGETMGTYFRVSYETVTGLDKANLALTIDSILFIINDEMSTYIDTSFIGLFNSNRILDTKVPTHFKTVFDCAKKMYSHTAGNFDPTVMPLTNYWGFGYSGKVAKEDWDSTAVKRIVNFVGFDKVGMVNGKLIKKNLNTQLDFSALAKGYAADIIAQEMKKLGIENMLIDIGGDGYAQGKSKSNNNWRFGINVPDTESAYTDVFVALEIDKKGLATSGNYRNYYEVDGELYGHTINVKTGFPFKSNVLSASVIANTAMEADALATACMASFLDEGLAMIERLPDAEAYLIYEDADGKMKQKYTTGFKDYILE